VVIAGAGFIGMELAASARARGASVHVVELADRPMARSLSQSMTQVVTAYHQSKGVRFTFGQGLARVIGTDRAQGVATTSGQILPADCVVIGVGVRPNVELAEAAGLAIENGIKVDAKLLTSDPAISAIGDCASFPILQTGTWIRLESVQNATDQGRAVASRLLAKSSDYEAVPWFWSDQFDMKIQTTGLPQGCDKTVAIGDPENRRFSVLCFREGKLIAVESLNRPADHMAARRLLGRNTVLAPAQVGVDGFDLPAWEVRTRTEGATPARTPA
jgi:NADPH-dependent 2,4-dienoyl-CoA reductase/sulfur reductase-like enzyme